MCAFISPLLPKSGDQPPLELCTCSLGQGLQQQGDGNALENAWCPLYTAFSISPMITKLHICFFYSNTKLRASKWYNTKPALIHIGQYYLLTNTQLRREVDLFFPGLFRLFSFNTIPGTKRFNKQNYSLYSEVYQQGIKE